MISLALHRHPDRAPGPDDASPQLAVAGLDPGFAGMTAWGGEPRMHLSGCRLALAIAVTFHRRCKLRAN